MATQAEKAAHKGDQATLYNITKKFVGNLERTWTPQSTTKMGNY